MLATLAFGLLLIGAFFTAVVLTDCVLRGTASFRELRAALTANDAAAPAIQQVRGIARRVPERRTVRPMSVRRAA